MLVMVGVLALAGCDDDAPATPINEAGVGDANLDGLKPGDGAKLDHLVLPDGPWPYDGPRPDQRVLPDGPWPYDGPRPDFPPVERDAAAPDQSPFVDGALFPDGFMLPDGLAKIDGANTANQPTCSGKVMACSDGIDNDGDGQIDAADPECTGPCDDDEGSFASGIPGDNMDPCKQDCFFDGNSGSGDDKCEWDLRCDPKSPGANLAKACPYNPSYKNCPTTQAADCLTKCLPIVPNGCDCFGCCQIFANGQSFTVYLGSGPTCSTQTPQNCAPCTPVASCLNTCGECELCLGKTIADLPLKCFIPIPPKDAGVPADGSMPADGGVPKTEAGVPKYDSSTTTPQDAGTTKKDGGLIYLPVCGGTTKPCLDNSWCPTGYYCVTGCCKSTIL